MFHFLLALRRSVSVSVEARTEALVDALTEVGQRSIHLGRNIAFLSFREDSVASR